MGLSATLRSAVAPLIRRPIPKLDSVNLLALFNQWRARNSGVPYFTDRNEMYASVQRDLNGPIAYLEFGVFSGESFRWWCEKDQDSASRFFGFDTFTGLPEDWYSYPAGTFSTEGKVPDIDDRRAEFVVGMFQNTVPTFLAKNRTVIEKAATRVIHIDCDLYSGALYSLASLDTLLRPNDLVIFDEFGCLQHEFKAWLNYSDAFQRNAHALATAGRNGDITQTVFKID